MNYKRFLLVIASISIALGISACKSQIVNSPIDEQVIGTDVAHSEPDLSEAALVKDLVQKCVPRFENSNATDLSENCDFEKMFEILSNADALAAFYDAGYVDKFDNYIRDYQRGYDQCIAFYRYSCCADESICMGETDFKRLLLFSTIGDTAREAAWLKSQNLPDINRQLKLVLTIPYDEYPHLFKDDDTSAVQKIEQMIEAGADINVRFSDGKTPIFYAKNMTIFEKLVSLGAKLDVSDDKGNTLLHTMKNSEIVERLIAAKLDVNAQNKRNETPLILHRDDENLSDLLVQAGAKTEMRDIEGNSFWNGTTISKLERFNKEFAKDFPGDKPELTILPDGSTPLLNTYAQKATDLAGYQLHDPANLSIEELEVELDSLNDYISLIEQADVANAKDAKGNTLLFYVTSSVYADALLQNGANPNELNRDGETPIFHSSYRVTDLLIKSGADLTVKNQKGQTPIFTNSDYHALIEAGADVNVRDIDQKTPIFYHLEYVAGGFDSGPAINIDDYAIKTFVKAGADINAKDNQGKTVLFYGLGGKNDYVFDGVEDKLMVETLVEAGADVNVRDNQGRTAIMLSRNIKEIEYLIAHGADLNAKDNDGKSVLDYHNDGDKSIFKLIESKMKP